MAIAFHKGRLAFRQWKFTKSTETISSVNKIGIQIAKHHQWQSFFQQ
jgi:hypothetical protein